MFVDDSRDFLLNFTLQLNDDISYRLFSSPFEALDTIHNTHQQMQMDQRVLTEYLDASSSPMSNATISLDLTTIHSEVYNPHRFSEFTVVVIDYAMPGMNGLEFCKKMENSPVKRILLTGRADEKIAVDAFNDGLIDMYIKKQSPNINQLINKSIYNLQLDYFQNMSDVLVRILSVHAPNYLHESAFIDVFNKIKNENNIVEYYLTENTGSFLMLDGDANISCLIVKNKQDLNLYYEMAFDNGASQKVLDQLQSGEKIPYFWKSEDFLQSDYTDWASCLYPAHKIEGSETYYYAYVKKPLAIDILRDKILPYNTYQDLIDAA